MRKLRVTKNRKAFFDKYLDLQYYRECLGEIQQVLSEATSFDGLQKQIKAMNCVEMIFDVNEWFDSDGDWDPDFQPNEPEACEYLGFGVVLRYRGPVHIELWITWNNEKSYAWVAYAGLLVNDNSDPEELSILVCTFNPYSYQISGWYDEEIK